MQGLRDPGPVNDQPSKMSAVGSTPLMVRQLRKLSALEWAVQTVAPVNDKVDVTVACSPGTYAMWWGSFLFIHFGCFVYHSYNVLVYVLISSSAVSNVFGQVGVSVDERHYIIPSIFHLSVGAVHAVSLGTMIIQSINQRALTFCKSLAPAQPSKLSRARTSCLDCSKKQLHQVFGRRGLLGIEGRHYDVVNAIPQIIHTSLQTQEAHELSRWVPNDRLSRFYTGLVVLHCFAAPSAAMYFAGKPAHERVVNLTFEIMSSFVSLAVVGCIVISPFSGLATLEIQGIIQADPVWIVRSINELKLLLIPSWSVMAVRLTFSLALLLSLSTIKSLLVKTGASVVPVIAQAAPMRFIGQQQKPAHLKRWHVPIVVWGLTILGVRVHTEFIKAQPNCALQVRPWLVQHPGCALYIIDCATLGIDGVANDTGNILTGIDPNYLQGLTFRGCDRLEMPSQIQRFPELLGIKIFNSTLVRWENDAVILSDIHPKFLYFIASQVNLTTVPVGLRPTQTLSTLTSVQLSGTNLTDLPSDLEQAWPKGLILTMEHSHFNHVPDVVFRMQLSRLSMVGNDVRELPSALFKEPRMVALWVNFNPIAELPLDVDHISTTLRRMRLTSTNVTVMPPWMNDAFFSQVWVIQADDTPFCRRLTTGNVSLNVSNWQKAVSKIQCRPAVVGELEYYPRTVDFS